MTNTGYNENGFVGLGGQGSTSPQTQANVIPIAAPAPQIWFNSVNITGATVDGIVVGQSIALSTVSNIPGGLVITGNNWLIPGTIVGGYNISSSSGSVGAPTLTGTSTTIFWVYPAQGLEVQYSYCLNNGQCSPTATATFNVSGPNEGTAGTVPIAAYGQVKISSLSSCVINGTTEVAGPWLNYGNLSGNCLTPTGDPAGIVFDAPTDFSNSSGGNFFWVQLISRNVTTGGINKTKSVGCDSLCSTTNSFPFDDSPGTGPLNGYTSQTQDFQANFFVMWLSSIANSIPVPVGYQTWGFSASATCTSSCGTASSWTVTPEGTLGTIGGFVYSSPSQQSVGNNILVVGYPTWTGLSQ